MQKFLVSRWAVMVALLATILLSFVPAMAQSGGSIQGTVVDPTGAVVAGATVQALDQSKGVVIRETTTGAEGLFVLQPLQPGIYTVVVKQSGMKDLSRAGLVLESRQVLGLGELKLTLGPATEVVTVEAIQPLVESATSDHANVITNQQVTEISMNGRDFQSLIRTLPGVVSNDNSDFKLAFPDTSAFHVNGLRGSNNNAFLDGVINTDVGDNGSQFTQISMDAVGEFKVQSANFAAEYGRNPGVLFAANTKSGGQTYHGTLYEFNRQDGFDANFLSNQIDSSGNPLSTPAGKQKLRFHQFGFNFGGPVPIPQVKKKLFFFFNYEGTRGMRPASNFGSNYRLPDPAFLDGDFSSLLQTAMMPAAPYHVGQLFVPGTITYNSNNDITGGTAIPGNVITTALQTQYPALQWSRQRQGFLNLIQPLYRTGFYDAPGVPGEVVVPFQDTYHLRKNQKVARIDFQINPKTNFFFRWVDDSQKENWDGYPLWSGNIPVLPQFRQKPGSSWAWNLVNVISPTVTNEFIFSYNHVTQLVDTSAPASAYDKTQLGFTSSEIFPTVNTKNIFPQFNAGTNLNINMFPVNWGSEGRQFTWTDNVTKVAGPHLVKFGVFYNVNRNGQAPWWVEEPNFNFAGPNDPTYPKNTGNPVLNMLLGNYYSVQQSNGFFWGRFHFQQVEAFLQDSWKVNRKLTLDVGLRWAYMGPTYTVKPFLENYFDPAAYDPAKAVSIYTGPDQFAVNGAPLVLSGSLCTAAISTYCPGATIGDPYNGMIQEGDAGYPKGFVKHRWDNFAPRIGFAYDPTGSGKTAIRGGAGVFYERVRQNVNSFDGLGNVPLMQTPTFYNGNMDGSLSASFIGLAGRVRTMDRQGQIPTIYSWSLGVQRELPYQMAMEITYVGNQARHMQYIADLNQLPVGYTLTHTAPTGNVNGSWQAAVPYRGYTEMQQTIYGANSSYNALQTTLKRRFSKSLMLFLNYTYSKNRNLADADDQFNTIRDTYNPQLDYGPAGWDRPHVFTSNWIYTLPDFKASSAAAKHILGGWEVTGQFNAMSGTPFTMFCGGSGGDAGKGPQGMGNSFCDSVGDSVYLKEGYNWINPAAFARPLNGTIGDTSRNAYRGPGYWNVNFSLFKNVQFTERTRLQLRLETFNTFNHHTFTGVRNTLSTSGPGTPGLAGGGKIDIGQERDPRNVQLGIKLYF